MEEFIHPGISVDMMEKNKAHEEKKNRNKDVEERLDGYGQRI